MRATLKRYSEGTFLLCLVLCLTFTMLEKFMFTLGQLTNDASILAQYLLPRAMIIPILFRLGSMMNRKNVVIILTVSAVAILALMQDFTRTRLTLILALMLMAWDYPYERILKVFLSGYAVAITSAVTLFLFGLAADTHKFVYESGHSWGMLYPNTLGLMIMFAAFLIWYLKMQRLPLRYVALFFVLLAILAGLIIDSRFAGIMLLAFPAVLYARRFAPRSIGGFILTAAPVLPLFLLLFHVGLSFFFTEFPESNILIRFHETHLGIEQHGITLFGSSDHWLNVNDVNSGKCDIHDVIVLDCAYAFLLLIHGIVPTALLIGALGYANYKMARQHDYALLLIALFIEINALMEAEILFIPGCFLFLAAFATLKKSV